jgi:hypothetical protein
MNKLLKAAGNCKMNSPEKHPFPMAASEMFVRQQIAFAKPFRDSTICSG